MFNMKTMKETWRGWGLSIEIKIAGWMFELNLHPFKRWCGLRCRLPQPKSFMCDSGHLYIGPIHFWCMEYDTRNRGMIHLGLGFQYDHCWDLIPDRKVK